MRKILVFLITEVKVQPHSKIKVAVVQKLLDIDG